MSANGATKADLRRVIERLQQGNADLREQLAATRSAPAGAATREEREALVPFAHFAAMWDANPIGGRRLPDDHVIYGIHTGSEWAADLTLGDFRRAKAVLRGSAAGEPSEETRP